MRLDDGAAIVRISGNVTCCVGFDFRREKFVIFLEFDKFAFEFIKLVVWERVDLGLIVDEERCLSCFKKLQSSAYIRASTSTHRRSFEPIHPFPPALPLFFVLLSWGQHLSDLRQRPQHHMDDSSVGYEELDTPRKGNYTRFRYSSTLSSATNHIRNRQNH